VFAQLTWSGCDVSEKAFMRELALGYEKETGVKIILSVVGVTQGIREVNEGEASMGGSCRHLMSDEENNVSLVIVAWDALVAIVNKDNPVNRAVRMVSCNNGRCFCTEAIGEDPEP
jgi:phosphate transport system substrate-binding protein